MTGMQENTVTPSMSHEGRAALALALLAFVVIFGLTLLRYAPPGAKSADADAAEFSAGRAIEAVARLVGDGTPRPVGSAANARTRRVIQAELEAMGYTPETQTTVVCPERRPCARVENVLARMPGTEPGAAVLLMAHHDSVGSGPGAADDASGVAVLLEVARILRAAPPPRNSVLFLVVDAEEPGLLGSTAFARQHPAAAQVKAVVNLEARGSSGASLMFETGRDNAGLIPLLARSVRRPVTSSVFSTIYDNMPNDTDFSVFKRQGLTGFNFAFVGDPEDYHRPSDRPDRLHAGSVQHQGDNALAVVGALAAADLGSEDKGRVVFFDLLALTTVWWPESWTPGAAVLVLLLLAGVVATLLRRGDLSVGQLLFGALAWWAMFLAGAIGAFVLNILLGAIGAFPPPWFYPWIAQPLPAQVAFAALVFAATSWIARWLAPRVGFWGAWAGLWLWWSLFAVLLSILLPGVSYLFLVPAFAAALLGVAAVATRSEAVRSGAALVPAALAALLWCALLAVFLYPALGIPALPLIAALIGLVAATLAPLVVVQRGRFRNALPQAAALVTVAAVVASATVTHFTADTSRPFNLTLYHDADSGQSRWLAEAWGAGSVPEPVEAVAPFSDEGEAALPWMQSRFFTADASSVDPLPAPELVILEETADQGGRTLRGRLRSPRGARVCRLHLPPQTPVDSISFAGTAVPLGDVPSSSWTTLTYLTLDDEGVDVEIRLATLDPVEIVLADQSADMPRGAERLIEAIPEGVDAIQQGHVSVVSRRVRLQASHEERGGLP